MNMRIQAVDAPATHQTGTLLTVRFTAREALTEARCAFSSSLTASVDVEVVGTVSGASAVCAAIVAGTPFADVIAVDVTLTDVAGNDARHNTIASIAVL